MKSTLLHYSHATAILIYCVISKATNATLLKTDLNDRLLRYEGDNVEMRCVTTLDNHVSWHFRAKHSGQRVEIFSGGEISPDYDSDFEVRHNNKSAGLTVLVILHANTSHSGEYICYDNDALSKENKTIILNVTSRPLGADVSEIAALNQTKDARASGEPSGGVSVCLLVASQLLYLFASNN